MKRTFLLLLTVASVVSAALAATAAPPTSLKDTIRASKWKQRVLLVAAPRAEQAEVQQQQKLLGAAPDQLRERDMLVLEVRYDHLAPADRQYLQQDLGLKLSGFEVVLIGKDGGVKLRSPHPLTPEKLFGTIDQMPMRRQEMRRGQ